MVIAEAAEGDIVIISEQRYRIMAIVSGYSIGCRAVIGIPGEPEYEEGELCHWFNKQTPISKISWQNAQAQIGRKQQADTDPLKW